MFEAFVKQTCVCLQVILSYLLQMPCLLHDISSVTVASHSRSFNKADICRVTRSRPGVSHTQSHFCATTRFVVNLSNRRLWRHQVETRWTKESQDKLFGRRYVSGTIAVDATPRRASTEKGKKGDMSSLFAVPTKKERCKEVGGMRVFGWLVMSCFPQQCECVRLCRVAW